MAVRGDGKLHVFALNVGQADTSVIVTPRGNVLIVDAACPRKLSQFLRHLGLRSGGNIELLVVTHPHHDHYRGANRLAQDFCIKEAVLSPFWHSRGLGPPVYLSLLARLYAQHTHCHFLSGYSRYYHDGTVGGSATSRWRLDSQAPYLELLGPTNGLIGSLERQGVLDTNHLSVMGRFCWRQFRMVLGADAQMENWGPFDNEGLLKDRCQVLKAAHHGSCNGTQWERLSRLQPHLVIVSADPERGHHLPDAIGAVTLAQYSLRRKRTGSLRNTVALTSDTGTIRITVTDGRDQAVSCFGDRSADMVDLRRPVPLTWTSNPTDWSRLARQRVQSL